MQTYIDPKMILKKYDPKMIFFKTKDYFKIRQEHLPPIFLLFGVQKVLGSNLLGVPKRK